MHLPLGILATHAFSILPFINNSFGEQLEQKCRRAHESQTTANSPHVPQLPFAQLYVIFTLAAFMTWRTPCPATALGTGLPLTVTSAAFGSFFRPAFSFGPRSSLAKALPKMSSCVVMVDRRACVVAGTNADESNNKKVAAMSKSEIDMFVLLVLSKELFHQRLGRLAHAFVEYTPRYEAPVRSYTV